MAFDFWRSKVAPRTGHNLKSVSRNNGMNSTHTLFTREGWHLLFILVFVLIGAVLRNVNLLVLLASLIAGMFIIQWRICRRSLLYLSVQRKLPNALYAGQEFEARLNIENRSRLLPTWLICVEERLERIEPYASQTGVGTTVVVPWIPANTLSTSGYQCKLLHRGRYRLGPLRISTAFPFGLMRGWFTQPYTDEILVRPKRGQLLGRWQNLIQLERQGLAKTASRAGVNEGEFYGLRAWQHGDSQRWIHWRTTARLNELAVRQFEQQQKMTLAIVIDLWEKSDSTNSNQPDPHVEKIISFVATFLETMCRQGNHQISVALAGKKLRVSTRIQNRSVLESALDDLAITSPSNKPDLLGALEQLFPIMADNRSLLVISNREACIDQLRPNIKGESQRSIMDKVQVRWINAAKGELDPFFKMEET
jgi:uncharacterized protein (DUF58 family)